MVLKTMAPIIPPAAAPPAGLGAWHAKHLSFEANTLAPHAGHVQFANPPGRHEPGVGEVAFSRLCALLDELGYEGHVGMEYKPSTSTTVQSLAGWGEAHGLLVR